MKKLGKWKQILISLLILPLLVIFPSGCNENVSQSGVGQVINNTYTVHFFTGTKETFDIPSQTISHGVHFYGHLK